MRFWNNLIRFPSGESLPIRPQQPLFIDDLAQLIENLVELKTRTSLFQDGNEDDRIKLDMCQVRKSLF